jgi:ABC transporter DrrB family efflux protein
VTRSASGPLSSVPRPERRGGLAATWNDTMLMTWRTLVHTVRVPELLVFATIQPVMFVLLFRYVFGGAIAVRGTSYVNYLMAGIFVQTVAFGAMTTGIGLAEDLNRGLIDRFRSLPMSRSAVVSGRVLGDLVRNVFVVVVMLAVGLAVGFRPHGSVLGWIAAAGLLLLLSFSFSWIGATVGLTIKNVEAVQSAGFIWLFPLTFASSAFVPTKTMPHWLRSFAENQPITVIVNAVRGFVLGEADHAAAWESLAWCGGISIVFLALAVNAYRRTTAG